MTDDRSEFTAAREAGLRQRHEQRLARAATCQKFVHGSDGRDWFCVCGHSADAHGMSPSKAGGQCQVCTDRDTKALVETATRLATLLALEEAAKIADDLAAGVGNPEKPYNDAFIHACGVVARHIRERADQAQKAL